MKKIILIFLISLSCLCLFFTWDYYKQHYTLYDVVDDRLIYLNPFRPLPKDCNSYVTELSTYLTQKDSVKARYISEKLLAYRDSYNEKQFEEIFSCGNDYWDYKNKMLMGYSVAYEITGQKDSASSCLRPLLLRMVGASPEGIKHFFKLQIESKGKNAVVNEIKKGLYTTGILDCQDCPENYYSYLDFLIGISTNELEMRDKEPQKLLQNLLEEYAIH